MKCEEFRDTLKLENADLTNKLPRELEEALSILRELSTICSRRKTSGRNVLPQRPRCGACKVPLACGCCKDPGSVGSAGVIRFVIRSIGPSHGTCICPSIASNCRGCLLLGSGN